MKRVLWISRHQMTSDQRYDLEQVLGDQVVLIRWTETVETVSTLIPLVEQADVVAAVLPTELLAQLWKYCQNKPLLQSVSQRVSTGRVHVFPDGTAEPEFRFVHGGWQRICRLELKVQQLSKP